MIRRLVTDPDFRQFASQLFWMGLFTTFVASFAALTIYDFVRDVSYRLRCWLRGSDD